LKLMGWVTFRLVCNYRLFLDCITVWPKIFVALIVAFFVYLLDICPPCDSIP